MSETAGSEAQNIEIMRRGYDAFAKGDIETLKTLFSANANWNQTEAGVLAGGYRGAHAIFEYFGQLAHESQGSLRVEPQTMAASGDHVFVLERVTGTRKGKTLDTTAVLVFKLNNGVVTEVTNFQSNHPADAQFWS
jgi:ketosteroid isomerase-like protein